jgi:hypothetical protein
MEFTFDDEPKPRKSPYFSLADLARLKRLLAIIAHSPATGALKHRPNPVIYKSLTEIFGKLSKMSDDNLAKFFLAILKNGSVEPNWNASAEDLGIMNITMCKLNTHSRRFWSPLPSPHIFCIFFWLALHCKAT